MEESHLSPEPGTTGRVSLPAAGAGAREAIDGRAPSTRRRLDTVDLIALGLFALLLAVTVSRHELGHDEAQAWNIARTSATVFETVHNGRLEGHTPLWHGVLWFVSRGGDPLMMQLLALLVTVGGATLLLRDRPFGRWTGLLILAGYYIVYEYAIVARPYVLTFGLCALFASLLYRDPERDPLLPCLLCGLVAFVSAYSALLSLALMAAVPGVLPDRSAGRMRREGIGVRLWLGIGSYLVLLAASLWFILMPAKANAFGAGMLGGEHSGRVGVLDALATPFFPHRDRLPLGLGEWSNGSTAGPLLVSAAAIAVAVSVAVLLRRERRLSLAWPLALAAVTLGAWFSGLASERHLGHLFLAALVLCWIAAGQARRTPPARRERLARAVLLVALLYHATIAAAVVTLDVRTAMTPWKRVAGEIETAVPEPYTLLTVDSYRIGALLAYLDRPVHDVLCDCTTRHREWFDSGVDEPAAALADAWCGLSGPGEPVVLVLQDETGEALAGDERLVPLRSVSEGFRDGESSAVRMWTLSEAEVRRCERRRR